MTEIRKEKQVRPQGSKSHAWKGEKAGYHAFHAYMTKTYGKPLFSCEWCGVAGRMTGRRWYIEWAMKHDVLISRSLDTWLKLCRKCHTKYDDTVNKKWATQKANKK